MARLVSWSRSGPAGGAACPEENLLASLAEGAAPEAAREGLERHLSSCGECRALVAALAVNPSVTAASSGAGAGPRTVRVDGPGPMPPPAVAAPDPAAGAPDPSPTGFPRPFGPYTIQGRVGEGGMGIVYEAVHSHRRRPEALKVLKGGLGSSPDMVARFHREVEAMANVSHDHVVRLYDSGRIGEDLYYTMPLLPGPSLHEIVREVRETGESPPGERANRVLDAHRVPPASGEAVAHEVAYCRRIAAALAGVADALATMHAKGVLHRDIKPGNLILDEKGRVLVSDFGLVRWTDQRLTRPGQTMGTPAYMSPEQVVSDGRDPDGRTDVYALGATLFELLALRLPHEGDTGLETVRRKLSQRVPPLRSINGSVPEDLETLVGRCLERRREDRYAGALPLKEDLERFSQGTPVRIRPVSGLVRAVNTLRRHRVPVGIAAAVLLGVGDWHFSRPTTLTVSTIPPGKVFLDGRLVGDTPLAAYPVSPGDHELRIERERFSTLIRLFSVSRGSMFELDRGLQAEDPADPVALRVLAAAAGLRVSEVGVEATRGGEDAPVLAVLFPRGRLREPPREVRLWTDEGSLGSRALLEPVAGGDGPLATWEVPDLLRKIGLPVPEEARARMAPGAAYRIRLVDAAGKDLDAAEFRILGAEDRARVEGEMDALAARFEPGDPGLAFLRVETLLKHGLHEEAYEGAVALQEKLGSRRTVAQLGLAVLDQAGLRDRGWWSLWVAMQQEAKEKEREGGG